MSETNYKAYWHGYNYFDYEKALALKEISNLSGISSHEVSLHDYGVSFASSNNPVELDDLVYFSKFDKGTAEEYLTLQSKLERSCSVSGSTKRQSTRYSVHGIHEYKGKFNPQVVRAILNIFPTSRKGMVVDPFCGSGTTLAECSHAGRISLGIDVNPLAVFIANQKQNALKIKGSILKKDFEYIISSYKRKRPSVSRDYWSEAHIEYLNSWFDHDILSDLDRLRRSILESNNRTQGIFNVIVSDLLRDYSLQEPADLRIRRRRTPLPELPLIDAFISKCNKFIESISSAQEILKNNAKSFGIAHYADFRNLPVSIKSKLIESDVSGFITSPPYANALPYIDTQRLSLVWLNLLEPSDLRKKERSLIGNREISKSQLNSLSSELLDNPHDLPNLPLEFCRTLEADLAQNDGFRRQAVPKLLYKYLTDMKLMFREARSVCAPGTPFAMVIGTNSTTLGGIKHVIDTPSLLVSVALSEGWVVSERVHLDTYQRYGIHAKNAVSKEELTILVAND